MAIRSIMGGDALAGLRANRRAAWPDGRRGQKRLDGLVLPDSRPGFRLRASDRIFTIGSCFARNIEARLAELGFDVPARALSLPPEERASDTANDLLNKYNPPAIVNELRWAFEAPFPDRGLLRLDSGLWHDPHLAGNLKPAPLERVQARRAEVTALFRRLPECRVVVATLGLVESWFDRRAGCYLNGAPPAQLVAAAPRRFRLDILSYEEVVAALEEMIDLVRRHGHPKVRMLLTVSPVPMKATYSGEDVLVANSYSKSVLRAAVGAVVACHAAVDYFPSYEAVTLTGRATAFGEDNRHVAPELVNAIMDQVIARYLPAADAEPPAEDGDTSEPLPARIRQHLKMNRPEAAVRLLRGIEREGGPAAHGYDAFEYRYLLARACALAGRLLEAEIEFAGCCALSPDSALAHYGHARVLGRLKRPIAAEAAFARVVALDPGNLDARLRLARFQARNGKTGLAEQTALEAQALSPQDPRAGEVLTRIRDAATQDWGDDQPADDPAADGG